MLTPTPRTVHLKDYAPPTFLIERVDLDVDIQTELTTVQATLAIRRNPVHTVRVPLVLQGDELELEWVKLDGRLLEPDQFDADAEHLRIESVPDEFILQTRVRLHPARNTKLMGLYASKDGLFTQCEAEGFRRITYFLDRPDVMARYTTTIHAERARYPVLLSNGNLVGAGEEPGGRHWVKWEDPFPKPSYLFALVAGKLDKLEDEYVTASGRKVKLAIYVEPGKLDQCGFAMQALKKSMKWDEDVFGLELDLDHYMIVAVGDFNMGAMENKGLNIFNTKYVLARPDIATDTDFMLIDRVVAHEYFHNWTGNRVTCRDWFQLSLKEGLTVFRDQEFGADMYSRPVQRIQEVRALRAAQFPEDAGPMAHPVRPQSYMEISNFYTATVYEKGAEVVRMIHTLLGSANFRKGMDLYFERHDGQAVTTDDFVQAMQDASGIDLTLFRRWYDQAGTPRVSVRGRHDPARATFTLDIEQWTPATPCQPDKLPLHIPIEVGLLDREGREIPLRLTDEPTASGASRALSLTQTKQSFSFQNIGQPPVPSLLRSFSAPVILEYDYSDDDLAHLMAHDTDAFNRWESGQRLALNILLRNVAARKTGVALAIPASMIQAFERILADAARDPAFTAEALGLPTEAYIGEQMEVVDPDAIFEVRSHMRRTIASELKGDLLATYQAFMTEGVYSPDAASAGQRALKNVCLSYLMELDDAAVRALCLRQFDHANNMTDALAALSAIANSDWTIRNDVLQRFYDKWKGEPLVVDKWLAVQASARLPDTLAAVKRLTTHPAFDLKNPNKVYALIRTFCTNQRHFHAADGSGYAFAADQILALDPLNPQIAARIARAFDRWKKFDAERQAKARTHLQRIHASPNLSKDTLEVVSKALA
ncbi:MAG TPA: aminopeptidase N [Burkholderiales bacterium]|nr:aminopeptidase N [Burkholderiales bacterium]